MAWGQIQLCLFSHLKIDFKNLQNRDIFTQCFIGQYGAHYCPGTAWAQESMARAWRALPVIIFFGNGQGGHWILPGRAGKTGTGMPVKHH